MSFSVEKCVAHLAILVYYRCYVQKLASIAVGKPGIIIDSALFSICTSSLIRYCGRVLQNTGTALVNCRSYTLCIKIELNPLAAIVPVLVVVKSITSYLSFLNKIIYVPF